MLNVETVKAQGVPVVSSARKLIFDVPEGPVVSFPENAVISSYGQNNAAPCVVVKNHVDSSSPDGTWQGADSNGVIIMNSVPEDKAKILLALYQSGLHTLKDVIRNAEILGVLDNYTTKKTFVDQHLSAAGLMLSKYTGIVKRDSRDVCYIARDSNGLIWRVLVNEIKHIDSDEILLETYVNSDGSKINVELIPVVS